MFKSLSVAAVLLSLNAMAVEFDKVQELNGVNLKSLKEKAVRTYSGTTEKNLPFPIEIVKKGVTNFTEKCNNTYKTKRKYTSETTNCKYHNEHMIESFVVKDIREMEYFKEVSEVYLLARLIYNRGAYGYYELVTVREGKNDKNQKTITVNLRMLEDKEAKLYTTPKFSKESAFDSSSSTFVLTQVNANETQVNYEYSATTDHWLLNKEVSVPQVFASISKSINDLVKTIEDESSYQKRELASKE
jgi:hypothetical protein